MISSIGLALNPTLSTTEVIECAKKSADAFDRLADFIVDKINELPEGGDKERFRICCYDILAIAVVSL